MTSISDHPVGGGGGAASTPDRIWISGQDVLDYYRQVADVLLPHLRGRPLELRRCPTGFGSPGSLHREAPLDAPDWLPTARTPLPGRPGFQRQVLCPDVDTLCYLAGLAYVEFHPRLARVDTLECPDRLVLDLDPQPEAGIDALRTAARRARDLCLDLGLVPFLASTGGRGLHVVAPLDARSSYHLVTPLASAMAGRLAEREPDLFTLAGNGARGDRIRLDAGRNAFGQTAIAPYSLRARPGAPTATPLDWTELVRFAPNRHRLHNLRRRLGRKADPWAELTGHARSAASAYRLIGHPLPT